ncbi:MFS transporter [Aneurinibacillus terranovensis]|uniref:MFS transporter n=1 Tax=Aneurinibacillus terranovensis TaxID=278991 RepID=UPI0004064379|nr:MFS transporter [Aneurinibacillus terranovensis]
MGQQQERLWTKSFLLLTICNLFLFLNLQMLLPSFSPYVKEAFHASDFTVSLVTSLFALAAIVTRFLTAEALQKGKRNVLLFIGLSIATLSTAGYYWCGTISSLLLMRIGFGIGFGMVSTILPTMVSDIIPAKRIGEGIGYFGLSTSLSMSMGPMIGLSLLSGYGFGTLSAVATIIIACIFPLAILNRPAQTTNAPQTKNAAKAEGVGSKTKIMDRKLLLPCFLNLLLSVTYGGLLSFLALFGKEMHISHVGNFFLVNAIAIFVIRPFSGKIFDSKGPMAVLIPGALLVVLGLTNLSFSTTTLSLMVSAVFYGLGYGMIQPSIQAWMIKEVSPEMRGMANGMFFNSLDLGVAIGAMLLGSVAMETSYTIMYRTSALFMVLFLLIYSVAATLRVRRIKNQPLREDTSA